MQQLLKVCRCCWRYHVGHPRWCLPHWPKTGHWGIRRDDRRTSRLSFVTIGGISPPSRLQYTHDKNTHPRERFSCFPQHGHLCPAHGRARNQPSTDQPRNPSRSPTRPSIIWLLSNLEHFRQRLTTMIPQSLRILGILLVIIGGVKIFNAAQSTIEDVNHSQNAKCEQMNEILPGSCTMK